MRLPLLPAVVLFLGLCSLGCTSFKYCHDETLEFGMAENGKVCLCSPNMGNCNVNCDGRACEANCDNKKTCKVDCTDSPWCDVRATSESFVVDCAGAEVCGVNCQGSESCEVDCAGAECHVDCGDDCVVRDCDLDSEDCFVTCGGEGGISSEEGVQDGNDARCGD